MEEKKYYILGRCTNDMNEEELKKWLHYSIDKIQELEKRYHESQLQVIQGMEDMIKLKFNK